MFSSQNSQVSNDAVFVEDVFSTYLYTGTGSSISINNGIDLSTKGGLVWQKSRSSAGQNFIFDTARGALQYLSSNSTNASANYNESLTAFNTNGFNLGFNSSNSGETDVTWTFRKQPKFFDVVTWTGDGTYGRAIPHSLGSTPGCFIIKCTSNAADWIVYHSALGVNSNLLLNDTSGAITGNNFYNGIAPTSTNIYVGSSTVGSNAYVNQSGRTYVAYLFASNAGGFGLTGTDNVISCGGFTHAGANAVQTLGYEPQFLLIKKVNDVGDWKIVDTMRGWSVAGPDLNLYPNTSGAEVDSGMYNPVATGFDWGQNGTFIYIAIRRGPMAVPTSGTSVFEPTVATVSTASNTIVSSGSVSAADMTWTKGKANTSAPFLPQTRLTGGNYLQMSNTNAESASSYTTWDRMFGTKPLPWSDGDSCIDYAFKRAPSFFDEVCYTGTGSATTQTHNLGVAPELMIIKNRSVAGRYWAVYSANRGVANALALNQTSAEFSGTSSWNGTAPTSSVFTVNTHTSVNESGATYVAYLFATCAGVSKVGSYTGTGTTLQINCGFTSGSRFVLIKRTDSTGDWYVWDSARGIVAGNDPYLLLNSTAAEVTSTDYVDTYSAGFEISSTAPAAINASGGTFIFLAIA